MDHNEQNEQESIESILQSVQTLLVTERQKHHVRNYSSTSTNSTGSNPVEFLTLSNWVLTFLRKKRIHRPSTVDHPHWRQIRVGCKITPETRQRLINHWEREKLNAIEINRSSDRTLLGGTYEPFDTLDL